MNNVKKCIKNVLRSILYILMSAQIIMSFIWMFKNISNVPAFGDTEEYIEIGKTLVHDEYRNIFYPLLLKVALWFEGVTGVAYNIPVFLGQTILCIGCIYYTVHCIGKFLKLDRFSVAKKVFFSLCVLSVPMITFMNFTVLPDSIAFSMLLLIAVQCLKLWNSEKLSKLDVAILFLAYLLEAMVRADRVYSCGLFIVIFGIVRLINTKQVKKFLVILAAMVVAVIVNSTINSCTQTPGCKGRVSTNASFILLDRVVWMNMADNYEDFSDEIKANISLDEAKKFDKHNNNVMYYLAPMLEERVGAEKASEMYVEMAKVVWENESDKVIADIIDDFIGFEFPHVTTYKGYYSLTKTNNAWNVKCMSAVAPKLTDFYVRYYGFWMGVVLFAVAIFVFIHQALNYDNKLLKSFCKIMLPFLGMCTIISLWFSVGKGAPPNDRYVLIGHAVWTMIIMGVFECSFLIQGKSTEDVEEEMVIGEKLSD